MSNQTNEGIATYIDRSSKTSEIDFVVRQIMGESFHFMPVVVSEINDDGTIDVIPLLFKTTATGENQRRAPVYNVPVPEIRVGNMAIIAIPKVGDKGFIKIADRDISKIKRTLSYSDVSSFRKHSLSDSVWDTAGACFNEPAQYFIEILDDGVVNCKVTKWNIEADEFNVKASSVFDGDIEHKNGSITSNGVHIDNTHTHGGVQSGTSSTLTPNP